MRLFLTLLCVTILPGLSVGQAQPASPAFRPLCERWVSPFDMMEQRPTGERPETGDSGEARQGGQSEACAPSPIPTQPPERRAPTDREESAPAPSAAEQTEASQAAGRRETDGDVPPGHPSQPHPPQGTRLEKASGAALESTAEQEAEGWKPEQLPSLRCRVLLAGDTMMEDFALQLNRDLRPRRGYDLQVVTRRNSCLSSSGRFHFAEKLEDALVRHRPDVVVLLLGCWDDVAIRTDEGYAMLGTAAWDGIYRRRVQEVLDVLQKQGTPAIWVGLPIMGSRNARVLHHLTALTREMVSRTAVHFIDNEDLLADAQGNYQIRESRPGRKAVLLRRRDGKHTTRAGDALMVGRFLPVFSRVVEALAAARQARGERADEPQDLPMTDVHSELFR